jgi:hypothetical protein
MKERPHSRRRGDRAPGTLELIALVNAGVGIPEIATQLGTTPNNIHQRVYQLRRRGDLPRLEPKWKRPPKEKAPRDPGSQVTRRCVHCLGLVSGLETVTCPHCRHAVTGAEP